MKHCLGCGKEYKQNGPNQKLCNDCQTRTCFVCGKKFKIYRHYSKTHRGHYCSQNCYLKSRWQQEGDLDGTCKFCGKKLKKSQIRYCSLECRKSYWNKNEYQLLKKKNIWIKKKDILEKLGGKCIKCGNNDIRVLDINHKDRSKKRRPLKGKYTWQYRLKEWKENMGNLELLCANCHRIHTWEQMNYGNEKVQKRNINYKREVL